MKKPLLAIIVCCGALLPVTQLEAAPRSKAPVSVSAKAAKKFGGLKVGQTFTMKVKDIIASHTEGTSVLKDKKPSKFLPGLKKGQKVNFTIGKKGELKGPGFNIKYVKSNVPSAPNDYVNKVKDPFKLSSVGKVEKNTKSKPTRAVLVFTIRKMAGFGINTYEVTYTLE